jgi:hypothetical protein
LPDGDDMTFNATAIDDVLAVIVPALQTALSPILVSDGPPVPMPSDLSFVVIGGDVELQPGESDAADMTQEWVGLGYRVRDEVLKIHCSAVGRASRYSEARSAALAVIEQVGAALPIKPTSKTYNCLVSSVDRITNLAPAQAGAIVKVQFTITAKARLVSS